jgi:hypothetical protein
MAIDRTEARRRVKTITGWAAAGAAALTAGFAFGASHGNHVAQSSAATPSSSSTPQQDTLPQSQTQIPSQTQSPDQGFAPPSASSGPPTGMSGGS